MSASGLMDEQHALRMRLQRQVRCGFDVPIAKTQAALEIAHDLNLLDPRQTAVAVLPRIGIAIGKEQPELDGGALDHCAELLVHGICPSLPEK